MQTEVSSEEYAHNNALMPVIIDSLLQFEKLKFRKSSLLSPEPIIRSIEFCTDGYGLILFGPVERIYSSKDSIPSLYATLI